MKKPNNEYLPGTCNLGEDEVQRRFRNGVIGLVAFVALALMIWYFDLSRTIRLSAMIPLFYSVSGFIQAHQRFCYVYGWKGIASLTGLRQWISVKDDTSRQLDRQKTIRLVGIIFLLSLLLTLLYYFI